MGFKLVVLVVVAMLGYLVFDRMNLATMNLLDHDVSKLANADQPTFAILHRHNCPFCRDGFPWFKQAAVLAKARSKPYRFAYLDTLEGPDMANAIMTATEKKGVPNYIMLYNGKVYNIPLGLPQRKPEGLLQAFDSAVGSPPLVGYDADDLAGSNDDKYTWQTWFEHEQKDIKSGFANFIDERRNLVAAATIVGKPISALPRPLLCLLL
eukprot:TRINITY_DN9193_c0_g1_i2.p1 TRINITY_DN9193_c0_g1~~TRINITY_DN9193_c0_g1_i2.p1  ORF type:complete len:209 (+),score=34.58 TRINITY_DN9193_c0_g1_i2:385-1011(+)